MNRTLLAALLLIAAATVQAEKIELPDGRVIELHGDGSWTFASEDRLLGTADGRQVRVRPDGTWTYTGAMAPLPTDAGGEITRASLGEMVITLAELAIETARSSVHKSSRKKTQTVFLVGVVNQGASPAELALEELGVAVVDSTGREYPVLQVDPAVIRLAPGEKTQLEVRADGSPHWFTTRSMELRLGAGDADAVVLKGLLSEARKRELEEP